MVLLEGLAQALSALLHAEGSTVVLPPMAAERVPHSKSSAMTIPDPRLREVDVAVDPARHHEHAVRLDHLRGGAEIGPDRHDPPSRIRDIGPVGV